MLPGGVLGAGLGFTSSWRENITLLVLSGCLKISMDSLTWRCLDDGKGFLSFGDVQLRPIGGMDPKMIDIPENKVRLNSKILRYL